MQRSANTPRAPIYPNVLTHRSTRDVKYKTRTARHHWDQRCARDRQANREFRESKRNQECRHHPPPKPHQHQPLKFQHEQQHRELQRDKDNHMDAEVKDVTLANSLSNGITIYMRTLAFSRIFWETLQSLATRKDVMSHGLYTSIVMHPGVWHGIWEQFLRDVPRQIVIFQGHLHQEPHRLFRALNETLGSLSCRWLVVFLNQAPLADMFQEIYQHVQDTYPHSYMSEEKQDHAYPPVIGITCTRDALCLTYHKSFRVFHFIDQGATEEHLKRVHAVYRLHFRPQGKAVLKWWYVA